LDYTFIDFFCGAGGFSEGFRQQGFKPLRGVDNWQPAINTHNLNFGLNDSVKNILDFEDDEEIEKLEDSDIILGSPPCVSFSMANKAGKANKSLGIQLIEAFLRIIAVKKHKKNSILKAWYMENVPNSQKYVKEFYTFNDLNLSNWAIKHGKDENDIALKVQNNGAILNSNRYGSGQKRERFICGEFIESGEFLYPEETHNDKNILTLKDILSKIPSPKKEAFSKKQSDPNYPNLKLSLDEITDHFYDTGLYRIEWEKAKRAKTNHPFMGKMSFPENQEKPSRTVMATRSGSTREALIYKSEYSREGDGEFRLPTIREVATIMGFPYVFNFTGSEGTKWKQIGNAVSPHMSFALAKALKRKLTSKEIKHSEINFEQIIKNNRLQKVKFNNLNTEKEKIFNKPPKRNKTSKFRRHIFKGGNLTVTLMNHSQLDKTVETGKDWYMYIFLGSGKEFKAVEIKKDYYKEVELYINEYLPIYKNFIQEAKSLSQNIPSAQKLHTLYVENNRESEYLDIETFFELAESLIEKNYCMDIVKQAFFKEKENLPIFQILSLYLINLYYSNI
jgi:DNA (cytosine-5)-methyltransferase 1